MKLEFSGQIFEKSSMKFSWKSVQWEPICSMRTDGEIVGQTDRHDEANSGFFFRNFANAPKKRH